MPYSLTASVESSVESVLDITFTTDVVVVLVELCSTAAVSVSDSVVSSPESTTISYVTVV